jgi:hypothetical protein
MAARESAAVLAGHGARVEEAAPDIDLGELNGASSWRLNWRRGASWTGGGAGRRASGRSASTSGTGCLQRGFVPSFRLAQAPPTSVIGWLN